MRRLAEVAILAVLFPHYALGSAGLTGKIQDIHNAPVNTALITLWDASTSKGVQTRSVAGVYTFDNLMEGEYLLKVEKDGYAILLGAVRLEDDAPHQLDLVLAENPANNASLIKAEDATNFPGTGPNQNTVDPPGSPPPNIKGSRLIKQVQPSYPAASAKAGIGGQVKIAVLLRIDGTLNDLIVLSAPNAELALAALVGARQWRYTPTYADGKAVEVNFTIYVDFNPRH